MDFKLNRSNLNFRVYTAASLPSTGNENDICVISDVPMKNWIMSPDKPSSAPRADGDVWIQYSVTGNTFNVLKNGAMMIATISTYQYVDGAWVDKEAKSYQGGAWVNWFVYLYANGDTFDDITGGWATSSNGVNSSYPNTGKAPSVTYNADSVRVTQTRTTQTGYSGLWHTKNKVSLAGRTKITALIENINYDTTNTEAYLQIRTGVTGYVWNSPETVAFATIIKASTSTVNTQPTIDLSSLNLDPASQYYVCIGLYSTFQADVKEIKIE